MNIKKIFIVFVFSFLITGCASVDYNLNIEKNLTVVEEINMSATKDYFDLFYKNLPITIVQEAYDSEWMEPLKTNNYDFELKKDNHPYPSVFATKKYSSLNEYTEKTIFKNQSFEDIVISTNENLVTIKSINFLPYVDDQTDIRFSISDLAVNIKLPYVVTDSNADKINRQTNTYTWLINEETENKEINITFDKSKIYVYNLNMYISIVVLSIIIIIVIIIVLRMRKKNKINNDIK